MTTSMWCSISSTDSASSRRRSPISSVSVSASRGFMPAEADERQQLARSYAGPALFRDHRRRPEHGARDAGGEPAVLAHQRVLEHGHVLEEPDRLEGAH